MIRRIDHVGIAVRNLDQAIELYAHRLGLQAIRRERLESEGVEVAFIPVGESRIELLTPLNASSKLHKFLEDRGEAVHHVAYATTDVVTSLQGAAAAGAEVLDEATRSGAHGTRVGFIHPKSMCGVLTELVEADGHPGS